MRNRQVEIGAVLAPQERQVLPASALPTSARSVLDGCEDEGILIAETNDDAPAGRLWVNHAAPFRRGFPPPLTGHDGSRITCFSGIFSPSPGFSNMMPEPMSS